MSLRQDHIPFAVGDDLERLIKRSQDLSQGVTAGPAPQTAPQGRTGFKVVAATRKAMGRSTGLAMGFKHQYIPTATGTEGTAAEAADTAADHDHITVATHDRGLNAAVRLAAP